MDHIKQFFNDNEKYKNPSHSNGNAPKRLDITEINVDKIADWLESELRGGDTSRAFYCKTAHYFPRPYLTNLVSRAQREGRNPNKLFIFLARKEMDKRGIE